MPSRCHLQRALAGEQRNKKILDEVKKITHNDLCTILKNLDRELVKGAIAGEKFQEYFFANCKCEKLAVCEGTAGGLRAFRYPFREHCL